MATPRPPRSPLGPTTGMIITMLSEQHVTMISSRSGRRRRVHRRCRAAAAGRRPRGDERATVACIGGDCGGSAIAASRARGGEVEIDQPADNVTAPIAQRATSSRDHLPADAFEHAGDREHDHHADIADRRGTPGGDRRVAAECRPGKATAMPIRSPAAPASASRTIRWCRGS